MHKSLRNAAKSHTFTAALIAAATLIVAPVAVQAEDMSMPTAAEVQYFSPEAQQFYAAGVAALDRADYNNAYNMLAKSAALQPASIHLNHIVARLAIYQGRQNGADKARDYYQTAIACYENILHVPTITTDLRRDVINQLKVANQEATELAQRDAIREATGTSFILDYNQKYATKTPRAAGRIDDSQLTTATETATAPTENPIMQMMAQDAAGVTGMTALPGEAGLVPGGMPGALPGEPGALPPAPGGLPGDAGALPGGPAPLPAAPGGMPAAPVEPGQPGAVALPPLPAAPAAAATPAPL